MARYAGLVSYVTQTETRPGVWTDTVEKHFMKGDMLRKASSHQNGDKVNSDVTLNHRVSLIADDYALGKYFDMKRIELDGREWNITEIEVQRPRIIVTIGGLYIGN